MGWNTTIVVMNDALGSIAKDPQFGANLDRACCRMMTQPRGTSIDVPTLGHCNVATVIETHHADGTSLVAVGGNYGTLLHSTWGISHHKPENAPELLKRWADELGYRLVKKPSKVTA